MRLGIVLGRTHYFLPYFQIFPPLLKSIDDRRLLTPNTWKAPEQPERTVSLRGTL